MEPHLNWETFLERNRLPPTGAELFNKLINDEIKASIDVLNKIPRHLLQNIVYEDHDCFKGVSSEILHKAGDIAVTNAFHIVEYIHPKYISSETALDIIEKNPSFACRIPIEAFTDELIVMHSHQRPQFLSELDDRPRAEKIALKHPEMGLAALANVKVSDITQEFIDFSLDHVSSVTVFSRDDYELSHKAHMKCVKSIIERVPQQYLTESFYSKLIQTDPWRLEVIPDEGKTKTLCKLAIDLELSTLKFIPPHLITEAMLTTNIILNHNNIQYLPDALLTEEVWSKHWKGKCKDIQLIPPKYQNKVECLAVLSSPTMSHQMLHHNFEHLPTEFKNSEAFLRELILGNERLLNVVKNHINLNGDQIVLSE